MDDVISPHFFPFVFGWGCSVDSVAADDVLAVVASVVMVGLTVVVVVSVVVVTAAFAIFVVVTDVSVAVVLSCFWETGVSSLFGLPGSTLLCWDGPQASDLACSVRLLLLWLWIWLSFEGRFWQSDPTEGPPALDDHHQILFSIRNDVRDGLEALPIHTHVNYIVAVCHPSCQFCWQLFF